EQRGAIFNLLGQFDSSLRCFRAAVPALRRAGYHLRLQPVLSNRAIAHVYRHQLTAAEADLQEAEGLCRELELDLSLAIVQQNLGWVYAIKGDVPGALRYFDLAERYFRALDTHQLGWLLHDRSELLLSVHLVAEARLERAADDLSSAGWPAAALESRLLAGRLALDRGWTGRGRLQLQQASRYRRHGPVLFRARAWYCEALARRASGNRRGAAS